MDAGTGALTRQGAPRRAMRTGWQNRTMKTELLLFAAIVALGACSKPDAPAPVEASAPAASAAPSTATIDYANTRFAFEVRIPRALFNAQGESDNGDGQRFVSADGKAEVRAYGGWLMEPEIPCAATAAISDKAMQLTYQRTMGDISIASGTISDQIFYTKVIRTKDRCLTLTLRYPSADKQVYDAAVKGIADSFHG